MLILLEILSAVFLYLYYSIYKHRNLILLLVFLAGIINGLFLQVE